MTETSITTKDIVLGLDRKVDDLIVGLAEIKGTLSPTVAQVADHEVRLRSLERFRHAIPSVTFLSAVGATAAAVVAFFH